MCSYDLQCNGLIKIFPSNHHHQSCSKQDLNLSVCMAVCNAYLSVYKGVPAGWCRHHRDQHIQQHFGRSGGLWTWTYGMMSRPMEHQRQLMLLCCYRIKGQVHRLSGVNLLTTDGPLLGMRAVHISVYSCTWFTHLCALADMSTLTITSYLSGHKLHFMWWFYTKLIWSIFSTMSIS